MVFEQDALNELVRVDPGARRPPADPRPTARPEHLPDRRRRAALAGIAAGRPRDDPGPDRGHRRRHRARDRDHREPPARGPDATRRSGDVRPDGPRARLQHPQARRQARQGQGLPGEPAPPCRRPARDPGAGVFAQGQPVARLRADEGRGPEEAPSAGRAGRPRRADAHQVARQDRRPTDRGPTGPWTSIEPAEDVRPRARTSRDTGRRREAPWEASDAGRRRTCRISDDSLVNAKQSLADAVDELVGVLGNPEVRGSIGATDRANLAKYLTIAKLRLENAIALVRSDDIGY